MRLRIVAVTLLLLLAVMPVMALAQTPIPPELPVPFPGPGSVYLTRYLVTVVVEDQIATTRVEQTFYNAGSTPVEATYFFPIPQQAAITEFNMVVDGQTVEGQIMRQEEARAIYEGIVRQQRDPALLEYVGRDLFQARIFPIPPGGNRSIQLSYSQVLPREGGLTRYVFPLRAQPLLVDGGGPHLVNPIQWLAISVELRSAEPLKAIYSSTHRVSVARESDNKALVGYEESNVIPTSDFDLYWSVDEGDIGVSLLSYKPAGEDGFFLLLAAPGVDLDPGEVVNRDVLLVLDTSGSMQGEKIVQATKAVDYILGRLNPGDRFNIISFSTGVLQFARDLLPSSQSGQAIQYVDTLLAEGSTDINRALLEALAQVDAGRPTVIIFITDGLPTVGETQAQRIIDNVRQQMGPNVQLFSFGVGYDVDTVLLDTISQENRGASAYVRPGQAIDEVVSAFYQKISTPLLSNLALDMGAAQVEDMYPYPLPDLFAGSQLVLAGRYRQGGPVTLTLSGLVNDKEKVFTFEDLSLTSAGGEPFIARLWATRKVGYLLNQARLRGPDQELIDEIVRLSTAYGIATPYTSFFVPEPAPRAGSGPVATAVPVEVVKEVEKQVAPAAAQALSAAPEAPAAGEEAVEESQAREALRLADVAAAGDAARGLRVAQDKTFAYQAGFWVDAAYRTDQAKRELSFGSDEYFALLDERPDWAPYFAVSPNLIVVLDGVAYVVTDSGATSSGSPIAPQPGSETAPPAPSETPAPNLASQEEAPVTAPAGQTPLCTAPAFGVGLLLLPGLWARWRRPRA